MKYRYTFVISSSPTYRSNKVSETVYDTAKLALASAYNDLAKLIDNTPNKENYEIEINIKMI